jgi:hypothetical protein
LQTTDPPAPVEPGYYVEDKWFGVKVHQAKAKARRLAIEYGRPVEVIYQAPDGELMIVAKFDPPPRVQQPKVYKPAFQSEGGYFNESNGEDNR